MLNRFTKIHGWYLNIAQMEKKACVIKVGTECDATTKVKRYEIWCHGTPSMHQPESG